MVKLHTLIMASNLPYDGRKLFILHIIMSMVEVNITSKSKQENKSTDLNYTVAIYLVS